MNSKVARAYGKQRTNGWTRVDMLIALYDSGLAKLQAAIRCSQENDPIGERMNRLKAVNVIHGIVAGLDMDQGEVPQQIARLCEFAQHALLDTQAEGLQAALEVLTTLRSAYFDIREEAADLELQGKIRKIEIDSQLQVKV